MMETIAYIAVYWVGVIVSYISWRYNDRKEWTVRLRTIALILSILSWLSVLALLLLSLADLIMSGINNESKSKW